jgi:hypothetical protein
MTGLVASSARPVFDIHGVRFAFVSDMPEVAAQVRATYDGARTTGVGELTFMVTLRSQQDGTALLTCSTTGESASCPQSVAVPLTLHFIAGRLGEALAARGLLLVHAAAVVSEAGGLVISGPSGTGKTTLALGLARRGLGLLSDEMAVLSADAPSLLAYRRSLHVRPGTPELIAELEPLRDRAPVDLGGGNSWSLTPRELETLMPVRLASTGRLHAVLLLDPRGPSDRHAELTELEPGLAAVELAHATPAAAVRLNDVLSTLGRHLATVRCARLTMGRLDDALDLICVWLDAT